MKVKFWWLILIIASGCAPTQPPPFQPEQHLYVLELIDQGTLLLRAGKLDEAEAAFRVAVQLEETPMGFDGLGCVAFLRGNLSQAEKLFLQAYEQDNSYVDSLANLALLYEMVGEKELAESLYQRAIAEDPQNFQARNNFAVFIRENYSEPLADERARKELLGARALSSHPVIQENLESLKRSKL